MNWIRKNYSVQNELCFSGKDDGVNESGVATLFSKTVGKSLLEWCDKNHRILYARLKTSQSRLSVIQYYALINDDNDEEKTII